MTTNYTTFVNLLIQAFPDYVTDVDTSTYAAQIDNQIRYNIQQILDVQEVRLDSGASYTVSVPGLGTGWYLLAVTCTGAVPVTTPTTIVAIPVAGKGYITTSENDAGGTPITGKIPLYGASMPSTAQFQGIVFLSTYNMTSNPVITSQIDGSTFQVFIASCVEDGG